ncbi:hypothetical protein BC834DRAFT_1045439 [Gloeopeniophorella convolvens]|nr:hypothetical protein BC834DRAFT_1045439 [Gloeopeniophorella convolvens]
MPRNPTAHFPPEVLRRIFLISAIEVNPFPLNVDETLGDTDGWEDDHDHARDLRWITLTHVCRGWREAALAYPRLWATPAFGLGLTWVEEMLRRSKNAPLVLDLSQAPRAFPVAQFLSEHVSRTRVLILTVDWADSSNEWMSLPAPNLERFIVAYPAKETPDHRLPTHPFANHAPNLKSIRVNGFTNFFWDSPILDGISHLTIGPSPNSKSRDNGSMWYKNSSSYEQLLSALPRMSKLELLELNYSIPEAPSDDSEEFEDSGSESGEPPTSTPARTIVLPSLVNLVLNNTYTACLSVLRHLHAPNPFLSLILHVDWEEMDDSLPRLTEFLERHLSSTHDPENPVDIISIQQRESGRDGDWSTLLLAGADLQKHDPIATKLSSLETCQREFKLPVHLDFVADEEENESTLVPKLLSAKFWTSSACCNVRILSLRLSASTAWDIAAWRTVAEGLPNVETLKVSECLAVSFFELCTPQKLRGWGRLRSVWVDGFNDFVFEQGGDLQDFEGATLDWLKAYGRSSLPPPVLYVRMGKFGAGADWFTKVRRYTQVEEVRLPEDRWSAEEIERLGKEDLSDLDSPVLDSVSLDEFDDGIWPSRYY